MRFHRKIVSAALAAEFLLSLLQLFDAHQIWYFPMIHGQTYSLSFDLGFSLVPALLAVSVTISLLLLKEGKYGETLITAIASIGLYMLFGLEAAVAWFSIFQIALAVLYLTDIGDFIFWLLACMTIFETTALIHWALLPFGISTSLIWFADLELSLFYILAPLAPLVVLTIFLIVIFKPLAPKYLTVAGQFYEKCFPLKVELKQETLNLHPKALLLISLVLSVVGALYPYSRKINPEGIAFGVDVHYYIDWMDPVNQNLFSAITVSNGSRPVMLWVILGAQHLFKLKLIDAIKYMPVFLNPLIVLSVFFMVLQGTQDQNWASLSSFYTASGFKITVGMYSYFLTNLLGLSLVFFSIGFLFKSLKNNNGSNLILALLSGSLVIFIHPWTFVQYFIATTFFLIYISYRNECVKEIYTVFSYLVVLGLVDLFKGSVVGGLEGVGSIVSITHGFIDVAGFWSNNVFIYRLKYGGFLSNTILFGLVALGATRLNGKGTLKKFMTSLLIISFPFYLLSYEEVISRLLYNIPLGVLAALGLQYLMGEMRLTISFRKVLFIFITIYMNVYYYRSLANLI